MCKRSIALFVFCGAADSFHEKNCSSVTGSKREAILFLSGYPAPEYCTASSIFPGLFGFLSRRKYTARKWRFVEVDSRSYICLTFL